MPPEKQDAQALINNATFLSCFLSRCPAGEAVVQQINASIYRNLWE